jgi:cytochrome c553
MKILKWLGIGLASIVGLVVIALVVVYFVSESRITRDYAVAAEPFTVTPDSAMLARGKHLVTAVSACVGCHGDNLGGKPMIDSPVFAVVSASNLTSGRGGVAPKYTDALFERAIRHGINAEGRSVAIMPSGHYNNLSDEDVKAIIAYIRSVPPVDNELKAFSGGPIARALTLSGAPFFSAMSIMHTSPHRTVTPPAGVTPQYGDYLVGISGCRECHNPVLSGGVMPGGGPDVKPASNITPTGLVAYDEAKFIAALREGKRPGGVPIDTFMPWRQYKGMTDDEMRAIWTYLKTVPPKAMGER